MPSHIPRLHNGLMPRVQSHSWFSQVCSLLSTHPFPSCMAPSQLHQCSWPSSCKSWCFPLLAWLARQPRDSTCCSSFGRTPGLEGLAMQTWHLLSKAVLTEQIVTALSPSYCHEKEILPLWDFFFSQLSKKICLNLWIIKGKTHLWQTYCLSTSNRKHTQKICLLLALQKTDIFYRKDCRLGENTVKPVFSHLSKMFPFTYSKSRCYTELSNLFTLL